MNEIEWTDVLGAVGGGVGALAGIAGGIIAYVATRASKRSAAAAEAAVAEAGRAAVAAEKVAEIETARRADESEELHRRLAPTPPAEIATEWGAPARAPGRISVFGTFAVERDYRVAVAAVYPGGSRTPMAVPLLIRANQVQRFHLDDLAPRGEKLAAEMLHVRFWPPVPELDKVDGFCCPCGRPSAHDSEGPGHWEWMVPIVAPPVRKYAHGF